MKFAAEPIVEQLALIKQRADPHAPNLTQSILADLIEEGTFDKHLIELRLEHRRRRDALAAALERHGAAGQLQWVRPEGGLYLWCRLPPRVNSATVMTRALADSVAIVHSQPFYADHAGDRELRLCFFGVPVNRADELARRLMRTITAARRDTSEPAP